MKFKKTDDTEKKSNLFYATIIFFSSHLTAPTLTIESDSRDEWHKKKFKTKYVYQGLYSASFYNEYSLNA